jgi:hypothetical protein
MSWIVAPCFPTFVPLTCICIIEEYCSDSTVPCRRRLTYARKTKTGLAVPVSCWLKNPPAHKLERLVPGSNAADWCCECFMRWFKKDICTGADVEEFATNLAKSIQRKKSAVCRQFEILKTKRVGPVRIRHRRGAYYNVWLVQAIFEEILNAYEDDNRLCKSLIENL